LTQTLSKRRGRAAPWPALSALASAALFAHGAQAFQFDTGDSDLKLRWDNTLRYSAAARVTGRDARVYNGAATYNLPGTGTARDVNADDGDRNFSKGLISNRVDLFSEMDLTFRDVGLRLSAAGWYDRVYNQDNDNDGLGRVNKLSGPVNRFADETATQHGRYAELLDAFAFGKVDLGGMPMTFRAGRYAQLWGESLFFGSNGIAAGMAPTDVVKLQSVPTSTAKETTMPVGQVGGQLQVSSTLVLGGYYQFEWRRSRFPAVGSYFSTTDIIFPASQAGFFGPGPTVKAPDQKARDGGQYGLQLRYSAESIDTDFGFYAIRYHDKSPKVYLSPNVTYREVYPENIRAYGASFNKNVGDAAVAGEVSMRQNLPLVSLAGSAVAGFDNDGNPGYAVGKSFHANLNVFYTLPRSVLWDGGALLAEVAANRLLSVTKNPAALDPNTRRDALALRVVFSPQQLNVLPGVDLTTPIGLGYSPHARSAVVSAFGVQNGGDLSLGLNAVYQQVWDLRLNYVRYLGTPGPSSYAGRQTFLQALKDRNFVSLSLQRAF
jgi:hypothetical protein